MTERGNGFIRLFLPVGVVAAFACGGRTSLDLESPVVATNPTGTSSSSRESFATSTSGSTGSTTLPIFDTGSGTLGDASSGSTSSTSPDAGTDSGPVLYGAQVVAEGTYFQVLVSGLTGFGVQAIALYAGTLYFLSSLASNFGYGMEFQSVPITGGTPDDIPWNFTQPVFVVDGTTVLVPLFGQPSARGEIGGSLTVAPLIGGGMGTDSIVVPQSSPVADSTSLYGDGGNGTVIKSPLDGSPAIALASGQTNPHGFAVDMMNVYWATADGSVMRAPTDGSAPAVALASGQANPQFVVVDGINVYWTDIDDGTVRACAIDGCVQAPAVIASGQNEPLWIAADVNGVYWLNVGTGASFDGSLVSWHRGDVSPTALVIGLWGPRAITLDAASVYFGDGDGTIAKVSR